jgi:hypothetical protein
LSFRRVLSDATQKQIHNSHYFMIID